VSTFTTALGETYTVERRLPRVGWRPRYRGVDPGFGDFGGAADDGILGVIGAVILAITLLVIVLPFLLFVAELALLVALVIPIVLFAIALGVVTHTVQVRAGGKDGAIVDRREVRGMIASWRGARELRSAAEAGAYRNAAAAVAVAEAGSAGPPV
jgi:hypothetical protein